MCGRYSLAPDEFSQIQLEFRVEAKLELARRYLDSIIGPDTDGRREVYLSTGPEVVDYLARNSEVKFAPYVRHPDYLSNRPGSTLSGRPLAPVPFDGRLLGADFALVRPPIGEFMALGGMMIGRDDIEPLARPFASLPNLRGALARLWRDWGQPGESLSYAHRAVYLAPSWAISHNTLGTVLFRLGKRTDARKQFEEAVSLAPSAPWALQNLCIAYQAEGRTREAIIACRKADAASKKAPRASKESR